MIKLKDMILSEEKHEKLNSDEYTELKKRFGTNRGCSFSKDKKGYYCYTHRARSKSHKKIKDITMKEYKFVCSTS